MRGGLLAAAGVAAIALSGGGALAQTAAPTPAVGADARAHAARSIMAASSRCATLWCAPTRPIRRSWPSGSRSGSSTRMSTSPAPPAGRRSRPMPGSTRMCSRPTPGRGIGRNGRDFSAGADDQHAALFGRAGPQRRPRRQHPRRGRPRRSARDRGRHLHRGGRRLYGRDPRPLDRPAQPESGPRARDQSAGDPRPLRGRRPHPHRRRPVRRAARAGAQPIGARRRAASRPARRITGA